MTYYKTEKEQKTVSRRGARAFLSLSVVGIFVALSVFYLVQVNSLIAKNFELRSLQKSLTQNQQENQSLAVDLTAKQSLGNLEQTAKDLNLTSIDKAGYLNMAPGNFALSE